MNDKTTYIYPERCCSRCGGWWGRNATPWGRSRGPQGTWVLALRRDRSSSAHNSGCWTKKKWMLYTYKKGRILLEVIVWHSIPYIPIPTCAMEDFYFFWFYTPIQHVVFYEHVYKKSYEFTVLITRHSLTYNIFLILPTGFFIIT